MFTLDESSQWKRLFKCIPLSPQVRTRKWIFVCFSFFITVALMQQHIKKGKEEKTDETSEGFSVIKKKNLSGKYRNDYKIGLFECVLRQWPLRRKKKIQLIWFGGKCDFDPTAECK